MIESFFGMVSTIGVVVLIVVVMRLNARIGLLEREIGALRSFVLSLAEDDKELAEARVEPRSDESEAPAATSDVQPDVLEDEPGLAALREPATALSPEDETVASGDIVDTPVELDVVDAGEAADAAVPTSPEPPGQPDIETALGTRWAVWVGGVALALGGIFLVRYTIEAGLFGPGTRLLLAGLFGAALLAAGEFIRRTDFRLPVQGIAGAYIPAILTAAGAFTLFGTVYAAHGIYGFIGPAAAFLLLGAIGVATLALALVHGQALAGVGLLGSFVTPILVASEAPNPWALFGYLAIVLAAAVAIARIRRWRFLASAAFAGAGLWCLLYMAEMQPVDLAVVLFINAVMLGCLALLWSDAQIGPWNRAAHRALPAAVPAFFVAFAAGALMGAPEFQAIGGVYAGTALFAAMLALAAWRADALPLLFGAGIATALVFLRAGLAGSFAFDVMGEPMLIDGFPPLASAGELVLPGMLLSALFVAAGIWRSRALVATSRPASAAWAGFAAIVPLVIVAALWVALGNPDVDFRYAFAALLLAGGLAAGGEAVARAEAPPLTGGLAASFLLAGAGAALVAVIHMAFGPAMTTILAGAAAILPALTTRRRAYPVLGWLSVAAVVVVLMRLAVDPTIVGAAQLGTTPVFNALLPGYGIPALAFGFAAWQLGRTTAGRPRLAMEASALFLALLTLAMLVRHAMHGGVIDSGAVTLAEQAIYTLIGLAAGAILISLDLRAPSSALRYGSLGIGVASVAAIAIQHFLLLNPLFTDEATGKVPFFNLLFLAYLLPALAAAVLTWYARGRRPRWYTQMLAATAAVLAFAYATLSVRRLFKGEHIGFWRGLDPLETYTYSALWLVMGVALLVAGVRTGSFALRAASGALIAIAVAKVFLFDMSELEGVLRAMSFIGLGAVLIGIGLFYQRLLTRAAAK